jgi:hypothetical protein
MLTEASDHLSLALLMCGRAEAEYLEGNDNAATECWQRAQALAAQVPVDGNSELGQALTRVRGKLESLTIG